ncbi:guanine nucleotide exchange factor MSS4 homolog [Topomyia yanbarensis]|uniref:guanine nucleotide exchange factor MSS4 homolog n=1 Tax=Topomyia yanbarensis TaxID=2498891 RepID=UPI00273B9158|nr:guanine nucleotide exchange factor MSS4 homolog [Topomyia yanbarensis]
MTTTPSIDLTELVENAKNKTNVKCSHCESLMLKPACADYVESEFDLPEAHQKTRQQPTDGGAEQRTEFTCEKLKDFWVVGDMFTFENIGLSHTVNNVKYLICADCEIGPVGYHDLQTKQCFIALHRVKHVA